MVSNDFHIFSTGISPAETDAPLIVDADAVLARTITFKRFETIAGWNLQIFKSARDLKLSELAPRHSGDVGETLGILASSERLSVCTFE